MSTVVVEGAFLCVKLGQGLTWNLQYVDHWLWKVF